MNHPIYIPLEITESAVLKDTDTILPIDVYKQLAEYINDALNNIKRLPSTELDQIRNHGAVSIDGARGTGKTSVLINLKRYLNKNNEQLLEHCHILKPIDPTMLENGESLFLHTIVAAVLHDNEIRQKQKDNPDEARTLLYNLERLSSGLESIERQSDIHGMDKVRAFYDNKSLADCVQDFIKSALQLLGKKLMVMPIDDVDASLHLAFENLEIIRRYLTTPLVLPIVSGDRTLYKEVTWRDFHGRLLRDSKYNRNDAYETSLELANEYQRKVLPLPKRLTMPQVSDYWESSEVTIGKNGIPLRNFIAWLTILIGGPVNGLKGSDVKIPIHSMRSLAQLIAHCKNLIPELPGELKSATRLIDVKRAWQTPSVKLSNWSAFEREHTELSKQRKRDYATAYKGFSKRLESDDVNMEPLQIRKVAFAWSDTLLNYFKFEPKAGQTYLILLAMQHWQNWWENNYQNSIFNTPLFQPLTHSKPSFEVFEMTEDLSDWAEHLKDRVPESWLSEIKNKKTLVSYPTPELGVNTSIKWSFTDEIDKWLDSELNKKAKLLMSLLVEHTYFTNSKQSLILNIGRVFEVILSSLVGPLTQASVERILSRPPFYSTSSFAPNRLLDPEPGTSKMDEDADYQDSSENIKMMSEDVIEAISWLVEEVNDWYKRHNLAEVDFSPWLAFNAFHHTFEHASNSKFLSSGMRDLKESMNICGRTFYYTWSAFGYFEKGALFGFSPVVSDVSIDKVINFEMNDRYRLNLSPFSSRENSDRNSFGESTRTVSYFLFDHPLRSWIDAVLESLTDNGYQGNSSSPQRTRKTQTGKELLIREGILSEEDRATKKKIKTGLLNQDLTTSEINDLKKAISKIDPNSKRIISNIESIVKELTSGKE